MTRPCVVLLLALSAASLPAQVKPRLAILPFTGGAAEDAESIAEFFSFEEEINRVFTPVPRTRAIENLMKEQQFQRSGLTDSDTIADLGKQLNADYVLAGHIAVLGSSKLLLITIIDVKELQQIAGDYREYQRIEDTIDILPGMAKRIADAARKDAAGLPRLAVLPFNVLSSGMNQEDAELLAQLLATELANSGRYAVFPRTRAIEKVMEEHHIERSGMTDPESIKAIGEALNAQYVLSANVRRLGADNYFSASILHIEEASQGEGAREKYRDLNDGLTLMPKLARVLTGEAAAAALVARGDAYYFTGRYNRALEEYDEAIKLNSAYAPAWAGRGNVYNSQENYEKGAAEYAEAIRLNPDYGFYYRSYNAWRNGDYDRAIEEANRALELMPDYVFTYNIRGLAYADKKDYDRAIADYTQAIRINPQYATAYNRRGNVYYAKNDYDRAISDYTEFIRINPQDAVVYTNRGNAYYAKKDYDRAIADYTQALLIDPQYATAYNNRERTYRDKEDNDRVISGVKPAPVPRPPSVPKPPPEPVDVLPTLGMSASAFISGGTAGWELMAAGGHAGINLQSSKGLFLNILGDVGAGLGTEFETQFLSYYCGGSAEILLLKRFLLGAGGGMTGAINSSGGGSIIPFSPYVRGSLGFILVPDSLDYMSMSIKAFYDYIFDYGFKIGLVYNILAFFD